MASPRPYDETLAQQVVDRIAAGQMLRDLWRDPSLPTRNDLRRWRRANPAFAERLRATVNAARGRRMSAYDQATAQRIFDRLCEGEGLRRICRDPDMPSVATVYEWRKEQPLFARALAIARAVQAEALVERGWDLAVAITPETARAVRVQLAHLRWHAGKVSPKKYGLIKAVDADAPQDRPAVHAYIKEFRRPDDAAPPPTAPVGGWWGGPAAGWADRSG
jgi:hypothetical protein